MLDFIYNEGSAAHRGVWHVTDNLDVKVHEAHEESQTYRNVTFKHEYPKYEVATGQFICGQGTARTGRALGSYRAYTKEPVEGVVTIPHTVHRALYQRGLDNVPEPLCSRCRKKAGLA